MAAASCTTKPRPMDITKDEDLDLEEIVGEWELPDPDPLPFNEEYYIAEHGEAPHHNKKGDWEFHPPRSCGHYRWVFEGVSYSEAKRQALEKLGDRRVEDGEAFILVP